MQHLDFVKDHFYNFLLLPYIKKQLFSWQGDALLINFPYVDHLHVCRSFPIDSIELQLMIIGHEGHVSPFCRRYEVQHRFYGRNDLADYPLLDGEVGALYSNH